MLTSEVKYFDYQNAQKVVTSITTVCGLSRNVFESPQCLFQHSASTVVRLAILSSFSLFLIYFQHIKTFVFGTTGYIT